MTGLVSDLITKSGSCSKGLGLLGGVGVLDIDLHWLLELSKLLEKQRKQVYCDGRQNITISK
jgi:hypothetical protein